MVNPMIIITVALLLISSFVVISFIYDKPVEDNNTQKVYSGPVRATDDEAYFRKTGITRSIE